MTTELITYLAEGEDFWIKVPSGNMIRWTIRSGEPVRV